MNDRIAALRAHALRSRREPDRERERAWQESLAGTEGLPPVLREAEAFAHYCRTRALVIHEHERIVGSPSWLAYDPAQETEPQIFGRSRFTWPWPVPEQVQRCFREGLLSPAGNHTTMDYATILRIGFDGLLERIDNRVDRLSPDEPDVVEKRQFLEALRLVARAYVGFCRRYGRYALERAQESEDADRALELQTIAAHCRRVPAQPPATFWEACQALWFCFFFLPDAPGRVDQYLYPFYRADLERGTITRESARELLSCLWIKYFEYAGAQAGVSAHQHLTLGGVRPDGSDASNELTLLCLDVTEELRLHRPQVGLRWHRGTPPELLRRAVRVLRSGSGNPDFCSDEQIVPALTRIGVHPEDARDFSLSGCHEVIVTGRAQMGSVEGFINLPKILRMTLGLEPALGPGADRAALDGYQGLWEALQADMRSVAGAAHRAAVARDREAAQAPGGNLTASLVVQDCIENARGYTQGGARYNHCNWNVIGVANLADSLAALRELVYQERALSLAEFARALEANWQGHEPLRQRVLYRLAHFGNDQDGVDAVAAQIVEVFSATMQEETPYRGGQYVLGTTAGGENMHVEFGRLTGATPDGRLAGEPLADSVGAAQGRDRQGVTALLNSVAKLPHALLPTATTLNVKLDPRLLADETGIDQVATLIEGHFSSGGQQCQFNLVTREMLLEAKRNPDKHGDLMVRVTGYSAPFSALWPDLQDEIIARTEHAL